MRTSSRPAAELRATAAAFLAAHLGFGHADPRAPVPAVGGRSAGPAAAAAGAPGGDLPRRRLRARAPYLRPLVSRHRPRVQRAFRPPAGRRRAPAQRGGVRRGAGVGAGRGRGRHPVRWRDERRRRRGAGRRAGRVYRGGHDRPAGAGPRARGRSGVTGGAHPGRSAGPSGAGVSPDRMLIGSEGTLGVITEAWVRVRPRVDGGGFRAGDGRADSPTSPPARARCERSRNPGCTRPTAGSSTPTRPG